MSNTRSINTQAKSKSELFTAPLIVLILYVGAMWVVGCDNQNKFDTISPAAVSDLNSIALNDSVVMLQWAAPGDDGYEGSASTYDIRYATNAERLSDSWNSCAAIDLVPVPAVAYSRDSTIVDKLTPSTTYHFGLKSSDENNNWSRISNITSSNTESSPLLVLSTTVITFSNDSTEVLIQIANGGARRINWTMDCDVTWLSVYPDSGIVGSEADSVWVRACLLGKDAGRYTGNIVVESTGAPSTVVEIEMNLSESCSFEMIPVPSGTFTMGSGDGACQIVHEVTLTNSFSIGKHEVTNQEYIKALQWAHDRGLVLKQASSESYF